MLVQRFAANLDLELDTNVAWKEQQRLSVFGVDSLNLCCLLGVQRSRRCVLQMTRAVSVCILQAWQLASGKGILAQRSRPVCCVMQRQEAATVVSWIVSYF